jgi:ABC-type sugar transport system ATPase subunit
MASSNLKISGLTKRYGDFVALAPTDLEVAEGEFLTLLGPSGSGKTTLLSLIAGLATPDGGKLLINGQDVTYGAPYERDIGMVFQNYALFPHMTIAGRRASARWRRWSWCGCRTSRSASPRSCRAGSSSASRWRAAWSTSPPSC